MNTNKIYIILIIIFISNFNSYGQEKSLFFIKGGINISKTDDIYTSYKAGYQIGIETEFFVNEKWSIDPSLIFLSKGGKNKNNTILDKESNKIGYVDYSFNQLFLQLPIFVSYHYDINKNTSLNFSAGPYLSYGVGGKLTNKSEINKEKSKSKTDIFDNKYGRFEFGVGTGISINYSKLKFGIQSDFGFIRFPKDWDPQKSTYFALNIGYQLYSL